MLFYKRPQFIFLKDFILPFIILVLLPITNELVAQNKKYQNKDIDVKMIESILDTVDLFLSRDPLKGMPYVNLADSLSNVINNTDMKYKVLYNRALVYRNSRNHTKALELLEEYIDFQKIKKHEYRLNNGYKTAGALYAREGQFKKSEEYLLHALEYYKRAPYKAKAGIVLKNLGSLFRRKGDFKRSLKYNLEALDILKTGKDLRNLANMHNSLGILYVEMDDNINAKSHLLKSLEINEKRKDLLRQMNGLANLASITNDEFERLDYFKRSLVLSKQLKVKSYIASNQFNLGNAYLEVHDYDTALIHLKEAEEFTKIDTTIKMHELNQQLAHTYALKGNKKKSYSYLNKSLKELPKIKELLLLSNGYNSLSQTYSILGDYKKAFEYSSEQKILKDSLMTLSKLEQIAKLETNYKLKEKTLEIESLALKTEINNLQIKRQRFMIGGLILFLSALSFLLYRMYKQKQKINQQNEEKKILLKEIHHRVKNNLQVISSLLGIQYRSIKDDKAKKAIQEGRTRVHSMALIHQNLYSKDNLSGIDMKNYLTKLSQDLFNTYNISENEIILKTNIENLNLDVETVIPIGLIINELITNSLKHAFPDNQSGEIVIELSELKDKLSLKVSDNGIGFENDQNDNDQSFGHKLIRAFKTKLDAEVKIESNQGTSINIIINNYKKVKAA